MGAFPVAILMMQQHHRRMEEEARRRRRRQEEERKRRAEAKKREEQRRLVEHRKNAPIVCNDEKWQIDRCVKAISMQPCVQSLVSAIEMERPSIIEGEERKFDKKLLDAGSRYEELRNELDGDIEALKKLGISIKGSEYEFARLTPIDTNVAKPEKMTESFGNIFTIMDGQPIELNPTILSSEDYFEGKYKEMNPEEIEQAYKNNNSRMEKYHKYGKFLKFLLKTKKYLELEEESESLTEKHEQCELRKKEMLSYKSLNKEQLLAIKSYFIHLDQLSKISSQIRELFNDKNALRNESNENVYDLTIKGIMSREDYSDMLSEVYDYVSRIYANDEETMKSAYELVKGEYPIDIQRRFIYDLIITNIKDYTKESAKQLRLE